MKKLYVLALAFMLFIITGCACVKNNEDQTEKNKETANNYVEDINEILDNSDTTVYEDRLIFKSASEDSVIYLAGESTVTFNFNDGKMTKITIEDDSTSFLTKAISNLDIFKVTNSVTEKEESILKGQVSGTFKDKGFTVISEALKEVTFEIK